MWSHRYMLLLLIFAFLSGCASLGQKGGYEIQPKTSDGRQEPWHNLTLVGDVSMAQIVSVAYVGLPDPLPEKWKDEFVDANRVYTVELSDEEKSKLSDEEKSKFSDEKKIWKRKPLERVVFRALVYRGEHFVEMFDAVLNPQLTGFFVLLPPSGAQYIGDNLVIVPSDASWLMTTRGETVAMPVGKSFTELPQGFFDSHPSVLTQVVSVGRGDPAGQQWFMELERLFPRRLTVHGVRYSGRPDTKIVAAEFTKVDNPVDRLISCGSLSVAPGMVTVGMAVSMVRNVYVVNQTDCFK